MIFPPHRLGPGSNKMHSWSLPKPYRDPAQKTAPVLSVIGRSVLSGSSTASYFRIRYSYVSGEGSHLSPLDYLR